MSRSSALNLLRWPAAARSCCSKRDADLETDHSESCKPAEHVPVNTSATTSSPSDYGLALFVFILAALLIACWIGIESSLYRCSKTTVDEAVISAAKSALPSGVTLSLCWRASKYLSVIRVILPAVLTSLTAYSVMQSADAIATSFASRQRSGITVAEIELLSGRVPHLKNFGHLRYLAPVCAVIYFAHIFTGSVLGPFMVLSGTTGYIAKGGYAHVEFKELFPDTSNERFSDVLFSGKPSVADCPDPSLAAFCNYTSPFYTPPEEGTWDFSSNVLRGGEDRRYNGLLLGNYAYHRDVHVFGDACSRLVDTMDLNNSNKGDRNCVFNGTLVQFEYKQKARNINPDLQTGQADYPDLDDLAVGNQGLKWYQKRNVTGNRHEVVTTYGNRVLMQCASDYASGRAPYGHYLRHNRTVILGDALQVIDGWAVVQVSQVGVYLREWRYESTLNVRVFQADGIVAAANSSEGPRKVSADPISLNLASLVDADTIISQALEKTGNVRLDIGCVLNISAANSSVNDPAPWVQQNLLGRTKPGGKYNGDTDRCTAIEKGIPGAESCYCCEGSDRYSPGLRDLLRAGSPSEVWAGHILPEASFVSTLRAVHDKLAARQMLMFVGESRAVVLLNKYTWIASMALISLVITACTAVVFWGEATRTINLRPVATDGWWAAILMEEEVVRLGMSPEACNDERKVNDWVWRQRLVIREEQGRLRLLRLADGQHCPLPRKGVPYGISTAALEHSGSLPVVKQKEVE